jgi:(p)ppGpp synthase/HD superfamily hydrolase
MNELIKKALDFATKAHEGQKRKYTGEPYIIHPIEVMNIVKTVPHTDEMLCAALLHDVVEDCGVTLEEIRAEFGNEVCFMVNDLTDFSCPEDGNRAKRKEIDRIWISQAEPRSKTIKLADLISNTKSICQHDRNFAKVYIKEKELLLEVLTEGDPVLYKQAYDLMVKCKKELGIV